MSPADCLPSINLKASTVILMVEYQRHI